MTGIRWVVSRVVQTEKQRYGTLVTSVRTLGTVTASDKDAAMEEARKRWNGGEGVLHVQSAISARISAEEQALAARGMLTMTRHAHE
jgi:hypothetical protein